MGYPLDLYWLKLVQTEMSNVSRHMSYIFLAMCLNRLPPVWFGRCKVASSKGAQPRLTLELKYDPYTYILDLHKLMGRDVDALYILEKYILYRRGCVWQPIQQ